MQLQVTRQQRRNICAKFQVVNINDAKQSVSYESNVSNDAAKWAGECNAWDVVLLQVEKK